MPKPTSEPQLSTDRWATTSASSSPPLPQSAAAMPMTPDALPSVRNSLALLKSKTKRRQSVVNGIDDSASSAAAPASTSSSSMSMALTAAAVPASSARSNTSNRSASASASSTASDYTEESEIDRRATASSRRQPAQSQTSSVESAPRPNRTSAHASVAASASASIVTNSVDTLTLPTHRPLTSAAHSNLPAPYAGDDDAAAKCPCPHCGRTFSEEAFGRHVGICEKVFIRKRKVFDSAQMRRVEDENGVTAAPQPKKGKAAKPSSSSSSSAADSSKQQSKWRAQSEQFRQALRSAKETSEAIASGAPLPPPVMSAPDPSLIQCPHCQRRFNETAAERHIPKCLSMKTKPVHGRPTAAAPSSSSSRASTAPLSASAAMSSYRSASPKPRTLGR